MAVHHCVRRSEADNGVLFNLAGEVLHENLVKEIQRFRVYQFGGDKLLAELLFCYASSM